MKKIKLRLAAWWLNRTLRYKKMRLSSLTAEAAEISKEVREIRKEIDELQVLEKRVRLRMLGVMS